HLRPVNRRQLADPAIVDARVVLDEREHARQSGSFAGPEARFKIRGHGALAVRAGAFSRMKSTMSFNGVPGPKTATIPASSNLGVSAGGIVPPAMTTASSRP